MKGLRTYLAGMALAGAGFVAGMWLFAGELVQDRYQVLPFIKNIFGL